MTEREALIHAVCVEPWDDTRRLAFADWLDENGDPGRAYLIRHADYTHHTPIGFSCLADFYEGVVGEDGPRRVVELAPKIPGLGYTERRGFVSGVRCEWAAFWANAKTLFKSHPITSVTVTDKSPEAEGPRTFVWHTAVGWNPSWSDVLPPEMRHHFRGIQNQKVQKVKNHAKTLRRFSYPTEKAAREALSDAATRYGRWLCGLPREYRPEGVTSDRA